MTPEGRVKKKISKYLDSLPGCWYNMPVPSGYGKSMLDYIGCWRGRAFSIEAKAPGEVPSPRQEGTIDDMRASKMAVFVIDGTDAYPLSAFQVWVDDVLRGKEP